MMALGKKCNGLDRKRGGAVKKGGEEELGLGLVRSTSCLGRKRVLISNEKERVNNSGLKTPLKKRCGWEKNLETGEYMSAIESLPQEVLVKVLCCVDHEDLNQLLRVSKTIREATLVAKEWHFAYMTPSKAKKIAFRDVTEVLSEANEIEAPNAPKQSRSYRSRVSGKNLADISVALFASPDREQWPRRGLFVDMDA